MRMSGKIGIVAFITACFTATLFGNNVFSMASVAIYLVLLTVVYHLKFFKNPRLCLLAEFVITCLLCLLLFRFNELFSTAFWLMVICFALPIALILEASEAKESWKRIVCYLIVAALLLYVVREVMFNAQLRIRRENSNTRKIYVEPSKIYIKENEKQ